MTLLVIPLFAFSNILPNQLCHTWALPHLVRRTSAEKCLVS